ncbi:6-hydroxymethylpterin diphosphokinase MptE-like protein [Motiliproteus sp.]|uniref:motility associated factor glycosyltransferase family protein n=1 Tax=Motiliproteus sp. TaxID=1898955 RepID=UPI003BAB6F4D
MSDQTPSTDPVQQIQQQFANNLAFFQQFAPAIYEKYINYQPTTTRLEYSPDENCLHLVDINNGGRVYPENPQLFSRRCVEEFLDQPMRMEVKVAKVSEQLWKPKTHIYQSNRIIEMIDEARQETAPGIRQQESFLLMQGLGLGYQIEELLARLDIRYLCVIEPSDDFFYASLAAVDWQAIYQHFSHEDRDFCLIVGESDDNTMEHVRQFTRGVGIYHTACPLVFQHLTSPQLSQLVIKIVEDMRIVLGRLGFFEDEGIGLAHTYNNLAMGVPRFQPDLPSYHKLRKAPVIVAANGPSLDSAREFLLENQSKAIICSCGTALESLLNMGIKPDLHFESERLKSTSEWVKKLTTAEQRKGITILSLNTVHSETIKQFEHRALFFKPQDLGTTFYHDYLRQPDEQIIVPNYCNPTVGNAGLSFASLLGFRNIYMVGLDLGYGADDQHHASAGKLFDPEGANFQRHFKQLTQVDDDTSKQVPGNFRDKVRTNSAWLTSRVYAERLIADTPSSQYFNLSDGVRIQGAEPTRPEQVKLNKALDKKSLLKNLRRNFTPVKKDELPARDELLTLLNDSQLFLQGALTIFSQPTESIEQAEDQLSQQHLLLNTTEPHSLNYLLLHGSVQYFATLLMQILRYSANEHGAVTRFNQAVSLYREFLQHSLESLDDNFLELDDRVRGF